MKAINIFAILSLIIVSVICGYFIGQQNKFGVNTQFKVEAETNSLNLIKILQDEKIENFRSWENDEGEVFFSFIRQHETPCEKESTLNTCQKLSIYNKLGETVYEENDFTIYSINLEYLTRKDKQVLIETDDGGTDNWLKILDYKNGKFTEIIDSAETQMRGGYWTIPEYRSGNDVPYFKPSQIFIIDQIGGADRNPSASIFRYRDGKYKKVGEISMQELGDFIETKIAEHK